VPAEASKKTPRTGDVLGGSGESLGRADGLADELGAGLGDVMFATGDEDALQAVMKKSATTRRRITSETMRSDERLS
jgi:hypothetical protein